MQFKKGSFHKSSCHDKWSVSICSRKVFIHIFGRSFIFITVHLFPERMKCTENFRSIYSTMKIIAQDTNWTVSYVWVSKRHQCGVHLIEYAENGFWNSFYSKMLHVFRTQFAENVWDWRVCAHKICRFAVSDLHSKLYR